MSITPDRLADIRARLAEREELRRVQESTVGRAAPTALLRIDADLSWLLSRVEQLQTQLDTAHQTIDSLVKDVKYLLSEFGHEHWQNCDLSEDDCYLCGGYKTIGKRWEHAGVPGEQ